jgi:hypothetical protein
MILKSHINSLSRQPDAILFLNFFIGQTNKQKPKKHKMRITYINVEAKHPNIKKIHNLKTHPQYQKTK